jgi:hypothetical protein
MMAKLDLDDRLPWDSQDSQAPPLSLVRFEPEERVSTMS